MRGKGDPRGRVYDIKPKKKWSRDTKDEVNEADVNINDLPSRTIMVVGRSAERRGWCRVACIVHQKESSVRNDLYLPISPTQRNTSKGVQLVLCFGEQFHRPSWVCLDVIFELPRSVLEDADMELQSKSFGRLQEFIISEGLIL
ncbi:hypothetical protein V8F06_012713 [Rhypophila decipiens]